MVATPGASQEVEVRVSSSGADEAAGSLTRMGDAAEGMKTKVAAAGAALAAVSAGGIAAATAAASKWNDKVLEMEKVSDAATADKLSEDMRELSSTIPLATTKLGDLAADAARFGIKGAKNIRTFVAATGKMAAATDLTTDQAGESFAKLATLTNTPIPKIENLGSSINSLGQNFATSASEITKNMMQASGSLSALGVKNTDIAGLSASMNEMYQSASMAGRGLRRLSQEMTSPKKVADLAKSLGMTTGEFKSMRESDPTGLMLKMAEAMKRNGKGASQLRGTLTSFSRMALTNMAKNLGNVRSALDRSGKAYKENESLQREFEISMQSLGSQVQLLKNNLFNLGVSTGQNFLPILMQAVKAVNGAVKRFNEFNKETSGMAGAVTLVSGLVAGLYTAFTALSGTAVAGTVVQVGVALSRLATPLGIAITALTTLGAVWKSNFAGIRTTTMQVVGVLRNQFLKVWTQLKATVLPIFSQIAGAWNSQGSRMRSVASGLSQDIGGKLIGTIRRLSSMATSAIQWIGTQWQKHGSGILRMVRLISTNLSEMLIRGMAAVRSALGGDFVQMRSQFKKFQQAAMNIWTALWPQLKRAAVAGLKAAWSWVKGPGVALGKQALSLLARGAIAAFKFGKQNLLPAVQSAIRFAWSWAKGPGVSLAKQALSLLAKGAIAAFKFGKQNLLPAVQGAVRFAWRWVRTSGVTLAKQALGALGRLAVRAFKFGKNNLLPKIKGALRSAWRWVKGQGVTLAKGALRTLSRKGKQAFKFAKEDILPKVKGGLRGAWQWVRGPGVSAAKGAFRFLSNQGQKALKFAKKDLVPKIRGGIRGMGQWTRNSGVPMLRRAFTTLATRSSKALSKLKLKQKINTAVSKAVTWVKNRGLAMFKGAFRSIGPNIGNAVTGWINTVRNTFKSGIPKIRNWLRENGKSIIKNGFKAIGRGIRSTVLTMLGIAGMVGQAVKSTINGIRDWLKSGGATRLKNSFKDIIGGIVSYIRNDAWGDIKGAFEFLWDGAMAAAEGFYQGLIGGSLIPEMFREIATFIRTFDLFGPVDKLLSSAWKRFDKFGTDIWNTVKNALGDIISEIQSWGLFGKVDSALAEVWKRFDKFKTDVVNTIQNTVSDILSAVSPANLKNKLKSKIGGALDGAKEKFESLYNDVVGNSIVPDMVSDIERVMERMDMSSPAAREMRRVANVAKGHASTMASVLGDDYRTELGLSGTVATTAAAGAGTAAISSIPPVSIPSSGAGQTQRQGMSEKKISKVMAKAVADQLGSAAIELDTDDEELEGKIMDGARIVFDNGRDELRREAKSRRDK